MRRLYEQLLIHHLSQYRQMVFLMGPRQVGKTTLSLTCAKNWAKHFYTESDSKIGIWQGGTLNLKQAKPAPKQPMCKHMGDGGGLKFSGCPTKPEPIFESRAVHLNWDNPEQKALFLEGISAIANEIGLDDLSEEKPLLIFDEIHKFGKWKNFLKGFFDLYERKTKIIVTGSARLNIYKRGGDSLMGRYFYYRIHPFSVAEVVSPTLIEQEIRSPLQISEEDWKALLEFGGFPEPFLQRSKPFSRRLRTIRKDQLFREDIRDATRIQELSQLELLAELLRKQAAQSMDYQSLAKKVQVSVDTIRRWIETLKSFYYCFSIQPWSKNISRSLIKEPKLYLWDWSLIDEEGHRNENLVASHLLKAVHFWTDRGLGDYELYYLRTKDQLEVDFLVTKNKKPWFLVEVKTKAQGISPALYHFQKETRAPHAFQVAFDLPFVAKSCFEETGPIVVPAKTFLSQLV